MLLALILYSLFLFGPSNLYAIDLPSSFINYKEVNLPSGGVVFLAPKLEIIFNNTEKDGGIDLIYESHDSSISISFEKVDYDTGRRRPVFRFMTNKGTVNMETNIYSSIIIISNDGTIYSCDRKEQKLNCNKEHKFP